MLQFATQQFWLKVEGKRSPVGVQAEFTLINTSRSIAIDCKISAVNSKGEITANITYEDNDNDIMKINSAGEV